MKFLFSFSVALLCFLTSVDVFSQTKDSLTLQSLIDKTDVFSKKYPQEKIHVHFDKPYYALGDTMWFKVYLTAGIHIPSPLSKIVYVDITNQQDSLIQSLKLAVNNGIASGSVPLDFKKYKQGNHRIRAYTRWMMNFGAEYFFTKSVAIANSEKAANTHIRFVNNGKNSEAIISFKSLQGTTFANQKVSWFIGSEGKQRLKGKGSTDQNGEIRIAFPNDNTLQGNILSTAIELNQKNVNATFSLKPAFNKIDLQFFPESGDLVSGILSVVGFKALNSAGVGINIKGEITDEKDSLVGTFESTHLGMGKFIMMPQEGKTYKARVTLPAAYQNSYNLPEVKSSGITLSVKNRSTDTVLTSRIICNEKFFQEQQTKKFYIIAKAGELVCYAAQAKLSSQVFSLAIPKSQLPTGIIQVTIFNEALIPQAERLVFVDRQDNLEVLAKTDKVAYGRRQKVRLSISSKSGKLPVEGNLSVSVVDESKVKIDDNTEKSIMSSLLLESDLSGFIEQPNYYFNHPSDKTASDLDVLMLTQGYRKFTYQDILAGKQPKIYFLPEQGIEITGTLRNSTGMPLNKANVRLHIPDRSYTAYAVTNGYGVFKFSNLALSDSSEVIISSADYSVKNPMLTVDPIDMQPQFSGVQLPGELENIDSIMTPYLQNKNRLLRNSTLLNEVVIKTKAQTEVPSHKDYPSLTGLSAWPDHLITKDRLVNCNSFTMCLSTLLTGVTIANEQLYVTRSYNAGSKTPMQIFFNGMPVDYNYLNSINPAEVESVEIFLKDEMGLVNRMYSSNGVLVINGKKAEKGNMSLAQLRSILPKPGEIKIKPMGYTFSREFYSPKYTTTQSLTSGSDLRSTIYWNPVVKTDSKTGNTLVEFYNADGKGSYRVTIEGMDAEGHIGRTVYKYKVD